MAESPDGAHRGGLVATVDGHDIIDCNVCGFRHVRVLPDPAAMEHEYRENYYVGEKPDFIPFAQEDQDWAILAQTDRLEIFESLLPVARRRILDIGCGPGFFLSTAKARGWQVHGIEPSMQAAAHARSLGVTVTEAFFSAETAPAPGRFDAVHLNNVLEHVPDPIGIFTLATGLLDPGGLVCVNVPNDFSPLQIAAAADGLRPWWIAPPHHLNYFDFASLGGLFERLGLRIAARTTSFPMEAFLLMGERYVDDPVLGRTCHNKRKRFDMALENAGLRDARRAFYRALAEAGMGREAVLIGVKS